MKEKEISVMDAAKGMIALMELTGATHYEELAKVISPLVNVNKRKLVSREIACEYLQQAQQALIDSRKGIDPRKWDLEYRPKISELRDEIEKLYQKIQNGDFDPD